MVDLVYGIRPDAALAAARGRGARVVDGLEILVHQGAASLRIWTGLDPPLETMRRRPTAATADADEQQTSVARTSATRPDRADEAGGRSRPSAADESAIPGLTPPLGRGNSSMFLTDVIVELGYASRERVDEIIQEARIAGALADELLVEHKMIDADQLSRAIAERYGLDHVDLNTYHVDMGAANLLSVPPRAATRRSRSATSTRRRCWSRSPTRRTCSRSTTST